MGDRGGGSERVQRKGAAAKVCSGKGGGSGAVTARWPSRSRPKPAALAAKGLRGCWPCSRQRRVAAPTEARPPLAAAAAAAIPCRCCLCRCCLCCCCLCCWEGRGGPPPPPALAAAAAIAAAAAALGRRHCAAAAWGAGGRGGGGGGVHGTGFKPPRLVPASSSALTASAAPVHPPTPHTHRGWSCRQPQAAAPACAQGPAAQGPSLAGRQARCAGGEGGGNVCGKASAGQSPSPSPCPTPAPPTRARSHPLTQPRRVCLRRRQRKPCVTLQPGSLGGVSPGLQHACMHGGGGCG